MGSTLPSRFHLNQTIVVGCYPRSRRSDLRPSFKLERPWWLQASKPWPAVTTKLPKVHVGSDGRAPKELWPSYHKVEDDEQ
ncbi:hypothetical protein NL676_033778 [Syzygium grande]|nr:hypothetical protein NL676_033778 [Syzygium grande]